MIVSPYWRSLSGEPGGGGLIDEESTTQFKDTAQSMEITLTNGTDDFQSYDMGAGKAAFSESFWFRTPGVLGTTSSAMVMMTASTTNTGLGAGNLGFRLYMSHTSNNVINISGRGTAFGAAVSVSANTWIRIEIQFVQANTTQIDVYGTDDVLIGSADITASNNAPRYLLFGSDGGQHANLDAQLIYFDGIGLDFTDSTFPLYPFTVGN